MLVVIVLIFGFFILIKGSDIFVDGVISIASNFKISKMVIGLTIVAFATSAPELSVSLQSYFLNTSNILLANVIGSNIFNVLFILGICALIIPIKVNNNTIKKEIPILLLLSILVIILFLDSLFNNSPINQLARSDGLTLVLFFLVFMYYIVMLIKRSKHFIYETAKYPLFKSIMLAILGLISIILGSNLVVKSSINIATFLGLSDRVIGLSIIAFGTSLPELVTSIVAAKKNEPDILVGNIVGSNIFNIGIVLGLPIMLGGTITPTGFTIIDLFVFLLSTIMLFSCSINDYRLTKKEGFLFITTFILYYFIILFT